MERPAAARQGKKSSAAVELTPRSLRLTTTVRRFFLYFSRALKNPMFARVSPPAKWCNENTAVRREGTGFEPFNGRDVFQVMKV